MTDYRDSALPVEARVRALLAQMTLAEKIGQMTQVEKNSLGPGEARDKFIGSVLSGGGGWPSPNTPQAWLEMVTSFQRAALETRLGIPLLYGVDAVHGHNNAHGATIFPHNVGLGATRDPDLVRRIGRATADEVAATGIAWNFAPTVAVPQDIRWGRTYEGYGQDTELVTTLGAAYIRGLHSAQPQVAATAKHYIGDGGTKFGSATTVFQGYRFLLDQGNVTVDEAALRARFLPPYRAAVEAGVLCIMVSHSSWQGVKLHAHQYLLTDVLKRELGFSGFLISDWQSIDQIPGGYHTAVVASINAGLDMIMVPFDYNPFIAEATRAVESGEIPMGRVDDAVRRILTVKMKLGLFERPLGDPAALACVGSPAHRALAREAVRRSLVLLKNEHGALPVARDTPVIFVGGQAADDIGLQCGGWTIDWLGKRGNITPGTTILDGLRQAASPGTRVEYDAAGRFDGSADVGLAVVSEEPYAEGMGDREDLSLAERDVELIDRMRARCRRLIVVVISGRPLILTEQLPKIDGLVAAWLPGTEGAGVTDVLFGDYAFAGKLPYAWPRSMSQIPLPAEDGAPLFPFGYGLQARS